MRNRITLILMGLALISYSAVAAQIVLRSSNGNLYQFDERYNTLSRGATTRASSSGMVGSYYSYDAVDLETKLNSRINSFNSQEHSTPSGTRIVMIMYFNNKGIIEKIRYKILNEKIDNISLDDIEMLDNLVKEIQIEVNTDYPDGALTRINKVITL